MRAYFLAGAALLGAMALLFATSCRPHKELAKNDKEPEEKKVRNKYAQMMGVSEKEITNTGLYAFIDEWYGTPYKYGGRTHSGIDCSDFVCTLQDQVYKRQINPPASSIYEKCKALSKKELEEGDLVFFKIESDKISHVGVYLRNGCFVHASKSKGVMISRLDENYYKKYFYKGGRIR